MMDHSVNSIIIMSSPSSSFSCSSLPYYRQRRRRLRRASSLSLSLSSSSSSSSSSSAAAVAAAVLVISFSSTTAVRAQHQGLLDSHSSLNHQHHHQPDWPNDKTLVTTTVAQWRRSLQEKDYDRSKLRPLDLVIDDDYHDDDQDSSEENATADPTAAANGGGARRSPPRAYQKGRNGFLEPYDFINYQYGNNMDGSGSDDNGGGGGGLLSMGVIHFSEFADSHEALDGTNAIGVDLEHDDSGDIIHHKSSSRIGLTNFDLNRGIGDGGGTGKVRDFQEAEKRQRALLHGNNFGNNSSLRGQAQSLYNNAHPLVDEDEVVLSDESRESRQLLSASHHKRAHDRLYDSSTTTSYAEKFAAISDSTTASSSSSSSSSAYVVSRKEKDITPPVIRSTFPPADTAIGSHQTFGALISDGTGGSGIKSACVQFKDHVNFRTACLDLSNVGGDDSDIWEQTFDGFEAFHGKVWKYRVQSLDRMRNRRITRWQSFTIDAKPSSSVETTTSTTTTTTTTTTTSATTSSTTVGASVTKLTKEVRDENWPYDGIVENAVGRVLFFIDSNFYVCSGTVLKDNTADRSIVLTAAHCAYQASSQGGRFAEHALFIPDQVDTTAGVSNEICSDDPLGCWLPAFAVVHYEWTTKSFPESVPWDYAYYVIPNDPAVHLEGFLHKEKPDLSKILEELVEPLPIDFNWMYSSRNVYSSSRPAGEFTHGFGYSINRDPSFRYCATYMGTKFGISTYENLWMSTCEMSGGSSGGPWLKDTASDGRGTIISLNSWGYASVSGMGGPNFATASGSKAECLLEVAKSTPLHVAQMGIVVDSCG